MDLSDKSTPFETGPVPPPRAGLRVAPAPDQPTGIFEVIEMAVLVLVTALAMVSIIVASSEDDSRRLAQPSNVGVQQRPDAHEPARHEDVAPAYASAQSPHPPITVAGR